jgi:hypothetical protein
MLDRLVRLFAVGNAGKRTIRGSVYAVALPHCPIPEFCDELRPPLQKRRTRLL